RTLLRQGVPTLPPATFRRPERVQRVSAEANDIDFVTRSFVDTALPVASVRYVADLPRKHRREKADAPLAGQHVTEPQLDALIAREIERGIAPEKIFLAGFSQGGAIILTAALSRTAPLAGLIAL
ncbi:hypothetical protein ACW4UO_28520, partial [Klebsiella pneumoniae]